MGKIRIRDGKMWIRNRKNSDPGWKKFGSGINIPDQQHWLKQLLMYRCRRSVAVWIQSDLHQFSESGLRACRSGSEIFDIPTENDIFYIPIEHDPPLRNFLEKVWRVHN
jgi:hypothetical protein